MPDIATLEPKVPLSARLGETIPAAAHSIGSGFTAKHFSEDMFHGRMDPLLMVDHFVMTAPTFDPHLHAGISAVTAMFEDSVGTFINRDTLGQTMTLKGGDLYWLAAAGGAAHEERPADGARVHALQIFVNLPARLKKEPARALHVDARDVPERRGRGYRVRVLLGRSGEALGASGTPEEMTMLDGQLENGGQFVQHLPDEHRAWIYVVSGDLTVCVQGERRSLRAGSATTVEAGQRTDVALSSDASAHFVLMAAKPICERFVKHGPLVMATKADVDQTLIKYAAGEFGRIPI